MKLTHRDTNMLRTPKGGFKYSTLKILGVPIPPTSGWRKRLTEQEIDEEAFAAAIRDSEIPVKTKEERKREKYGEDLETFGQVRDLMKRLHDCNVSTSYAAHTVWKAICRGRKSS